MPGKKALIIAFDYPPLRSSNDRTFHFTKYLVQLGWKITVLTIRGQTPFHFFDTSITIPPNISVIRTAAWENRWTQALYGYRLTPFHNLFCIPAFFAGFCLLRKEHFELIFATTPQVSEIIAGHWLSRIFNIPLFLDFRDPYYPPLLYRRFFRSILRNAKSIITTSDAYRLILEKQSGRSDISVIMNGVDVTQVQSYKNPANKEFTIVYTGALIPTYRVGALLQAIAALKMSFLGKVLIIGDTRGSEDLVVYAREKKLPVTFTGRLPYAEAMAMTSAATVAYNGSDHAGGIGAKIYEYMALGLPLLCYFPPGSQSDLLVRSLGIGTIAHSIDELSRDITRLVKNEGLRKALALQCQRMVWQFDRKLLTQQLADKIDSLLDFRPHTIDGTAKTGE